jgi:hypothetical protein
MAKRKIELPNCNFRSASITIGAPCITSVTITSAFTPAIAEVLGIKTNVYKQPDSEDVAVREVGLTCKLYGPEIVIGPRQGRLDGENRFTLPNVLTLEIEKVQRHKDDEQMLLTSKLTLVDSDSHAQQLIYMLKKEMFDLEVGLANRKEAAEAEKQMRLVAPKRGRPEADEGESGGQLEAQIEEIAKSRKTN